VKIAVKIMLKLVEPDAKSMQNRIPESGEGPCMHGPSSTFG